MRAVLSFSVKGRLQHVTLPRVYTIGRAPACDLVLDHGFVSNTHCTFTADGDSVSVVDHDSSNGTVVNGVAIRGKTPLEPGDVIEVGPYVLTLSFAEKTIEAGAPTVPRPAVTLGLQMKTMTEPQPVHSVAIEVVDGPRPKDGSPRTSFRDAVKSKAGTTLVVGDLEACVDAASIVGEVRHALRDLASAGAGPEAVVVGVAGLLHRKQRRAQLMVARIDAERQKVTWVNAHQGEPLVLRASTISLAKLDGMRAAHPLGDVPDPEVPEHEIKLGAGDVLVLPSATVVGIFRMLWDLDPPTLPSSRRGAAMAMWLTNQAVKSGEGGCAVCAEITRA